VVGEEVADVSNVSARLPPDVTDVLAAGVLDQMERFAFSL
jgi:hypothetical protein